MIVMNAVSLWISRSSIAVMLFTASAQACGLDWGPPGSKWLNADDEGKFEFWDVIDEVRLSDTEVIPLRVRFSTSGRHHPILGAGWEFSLFDSRIEKTSENLYTIYQPDGQVSRLRGRGGNILQGDGWAAKVEGNRVSCVASCGWKLVFEDGRLKSMSTANGTNVFVTRSAELFGLMTSDGRTLASFTVPSLDDDSVEGRVNERKLALNLGVRPLGVSEQKLAGVPEASSLESVVADGVRKNTYRIVPSANGSEIGFETGSGKFSWAADNGMLSSMDGSRVSFLKVQGVECMALEKNGSSIVEGRRENVSITQSPGQLPHLTEYCVAGKMAGKPRKVFELRPNGEKSLIRQYAYGVGGSVISDLQYYQSDQGERLECLKRFNESGDLIYLAKDGREVSFDHQDDGVSIRIKTDEGTNTAKISREEFSKIVIK